MSEQPKNFPEFYVTSAQPCPYLPDRLERKLFTHLTTDKSAALVDNLLKGGFRRSQNIAYTPYCDGCQACVSVRVLVDAFKPSRNMKRIMAANRDIKVTRHPARPTAEQYSLFRDYIDVRHGDGGMADMSVLDYAQMVEDSVVNTFITEFRLPAAAPGVQRAAGQAVQVEQTVSCPRGFSDGISERAPESAPGQLPGQLPGQFSGQFSGQLPGQPSGRLVGAALCDRLSDGISMVYSFYGVDEASRSLGSYIILEHIEYARALGLPYVYLGYWIKGAQKMHYKTRFVPQEHLTANGWERVD